MKETNFFLIILIISLHEFQKFEHKKGERKKRITIQKKINELQLYFNS